MPGLLLPLPLHAQPCGLDKADEQVQVRHVHDGDTLWLADGRKLRIIGVNTPELARDDKPAEPLAKQARDSLRSLIGNNTRLQLRYGQEKHDRYDRLLAHVFLSNGQNISQWLLEQGLAYSLTVPPNTWQFDCYQQAEQKARQRNKGLWSKQYSRVLPADRLSNDLRGFQIIRGRINRVGHSNNTVWLNFNRQFAVRILRKDLRWFQNMDFEKLKGKQLEVRGWVQYHKRQLRMRIKHPSAIQISP
ncbi:MAG: thermonuclease family protein [Gammaproteobacteria bacterium]|nr:thermonuclease family protein [Gammaproteobacteria bacterium]